MLVAVLIMLLRGPVCDLLYSIEKWLKHIVTRDTKPEAGQVWMSPGSSLFITKVHEDGHVRIRMGSVSFSKSPDEWTKMVHGNKYYLCRKNKG